MAKNYYEILGVEKTADDETIKKAYRKLVRKYHPDVSKEPDAAERTTEINLAYETLSNPEKRAQYDAELAHPRGNPFQGAAGGGNPFEGFNFNGQDIHFDFGGSGAFGDIFSQFFGGTGGGQGQGAGGHPGLGQGLLVIPPSEGGAGSGQECDGCTCGDQGTGGTGHEHPP